MTRTIVCFALGASLAGCTQGTTSGESAAQPRVAATPARSRLVPLVDHHQHIFGPMLADPPHEQLPTIALPAELDRLLRARERITEATPLADVYTEDALVLDISDAEDHWVRGERAIRYLLGAYEAGTRFIPKTYAAGASTGYIAGVVPGADTTEDVLHFSFGLKKNVSGTWRIAVEAVTLKPARGFAKPITAEKIIEHLDDAGIERAAVLSTAFWGSGGATLREGEQAKVRAANDWVVEQVSRYRNRLVPFCAVNPIKPYAIEELERCAKLPGVRGMKLHFGNSRIDVKRPDQVERLQRFFKAANDTRMAIVVHLWTLDKSYGRDHSRIFLDQVLPSAPDITIQIAHMAGAGRYVHDDAMEVFADAIAAGDPRTRHLYFDLATVVDEQISPEMLALLTKRIRQVGPGRILFGSDMPIIRRPPPVLTWATTRRRLPLTDAELSVIANNVAPYMRP